MLRASRSPTAAGSTRPRTMRMAATEMARSRRSLPAGALLVSPVLATQAARASEDIPRTAGGKPDFSGIWETLSGADYDLEPHAGRSDAPPGAGVVDAGLLPYQPWA